MSEVVRKSSTPEGKEIWEMVKEAGRDTPHWINERPAWCPHNCCIHIRSMTGTICGGKLPRSVKHEVDFNTHRFCLNGAGDDGGVFDLQVNRSDLYWLSLLFEAIKEDMTLAPTDEPEGEK